MLNFRIKKLFGTHDIEMNLSDRCAIIIGENGVGKTTALKILNCLSSGDFIGLTQFPFQTLELKKDKIGIQINYEDLFPNINELIQLDTKLDTMSMLKFFCYAVSRVDWPNSSLETQKVVNLLEGIFKQNKSYYFSVLSASYWNNNTNNKFIIRKEEKLKIRTLLNEISHDKCFLLSPISSNSKYQKITQSIRKLLGINKKSNGYSANNYPVFLYNTLDSYVLTNDFNRFPVNKSLSEKSMESHNWLNYFDNLSLDDAIDSILSSHYDSINHTKENNHRTELFDSLERKQLPIGDLISSLYFNLDEIILINKKALTYLEKFKENSFSVYYKENANDFDPNLIKMVIDFYKTNKRDIERYIIPVLIKDSIYANVIDREYYDIYENDNFINYTPEFVSLALIQFFKENINYLRKSSSRKIILYQKTLNYFLFNKKVIVSPNGLIIENRVGEEIDISLLSSGEKKIITMITIATFFDNSIFLIDEPEISLSVVWQSWLLPTLLKINKSQKLVVATHSPNIAEDESVHKYVQPIYIELVGEEEHE